MEAKDTCFCEEKFFHFLPKINLESKPLNSIITTSELNVSYSIEIISDESILKNLHVANTS